MEKRFYTATISLAGIIILSFFDTYLSLLFYKLIVLTLTIFCLVIFPIEVYLSAFKNPLSRKGFVGIGIAIGTIYSLYNLIKTGVSGNIVQVGVIALIYYLYNFYYETKNIFDYSVERIKKHNLSNLEKKSYYIYDFAGWAIILFFLVCALIFNNIFTDRYNLIISLLLLILFSSNLEIFKLGVLLPLIVCKHKINKLEAFYHNTTLIENVSLSKDLIFDVRGVVTNDIYYLENIHASNPKYALQIASSLMQNDKHSLSLAVLKEAKKQEINLHYISHINKFEGMGIIGRIGDENYAIGNMELMKEVDIVVGVLLREKIKLENQGKTVLILAKTLVNKKNYEKNPGEVIGLLIFNNPVQTGFEKVKGNFARKELNTIYLSGEEKNTILMRLKNIVSENLISNFSDKDKRKYIEDMAEKQSDRIFISISKKLSFDNKNIINLLIDNKLKNQISANTLAIDNYKPEKLMKIYNIMVKSYQKAVLNYKFSCLYNTLVMIVAVGFAKSLNGKYEFLLVFILSILSERFIIFNSKLKHNDN